MRVFFALAFLPLALMAKPSGGEVVAGDARIAQMGKTTQIKTSDRAIINWDTFSIKNGETVRFDQPRISSAVLNRVSSGVSNLDGLLQANGKVYLVNPKGVVIGKGGEVVCNGFVAATLDCENQAFLGDSDLLFRGDSRAEIVNYGRVKATGGDVILIGRAVRNEGFLAAPEGTVAIGAGSEVLLKPEHFQKIYIAPTSPDEREEGGIENSGTIEAFRTELIADGNAFRFAINQKGVIEANSLEEKNGRIYLIADGGAAINYGAIKAESGRIHVFADQIGGEAGSQIDASGPMKGGEVLFGGDFQGTLGRCQANSSATVLQEGAVIRADATEFGDGGRVILWSDGITIMEGEVSARGGPRSGDGGFIEVSGLEGLHQVGVISTEAPMGKGGDILLDPYNLTISGAAPSGSTLTTTATGASYTLFADDAVIRTTGPSPGLVTVLVTVFAGSRGTVAISTEGAGTQAGDIAITDDILWAADNELIINADGDINITNAQIGSSGTGASIIFSAGGGITCNSSISTMGSDSLVSLGAKGDIDLSDGTIDVLSGDISILSEGSINISGATMGLTIQDLGVMNIRALGSITVDPDPGTGAQIATGNGQVTMQAGEEITIAGEVTNIFSGSSGVTIIADGTINIATTSGTLNIEANQGKPVEIASKESIIVGGNIGIIGTQFGDINIFASEDISFASATGLSFDSDSSNVDYQFTAGRDITFGAGVNAINAGMDSMDVSINAKRNLTFLSSPITAEMEVLIGTNGALSMAAGSSLSIGTTASTKPLRITADTASPISVFSEGDLSVNGGSATGANVLIQGTEIPSFSFLSNGSMTFRAGGEDSDVLVTSLESGNIDVRAGNNIFLVGGADANSSVHIQQQQGSGTVIGSGVNVRSSGGSVSLLAGSGTNADTIIGITSTAVGPAITASGEVNVEAGGGEVFVTSSEGTAHIGPFISVNSPIAFTGAVNVDAEGDVVISSGATTPAGIGVLAAIDAPVTATSFDVTVTSGGVILASGGANAYIGAEIDAPSANIALSSVNVKSTGTVSLVPGAVTGNALIGVSPTSGAGSTGRISIDSGFFDMRGAALGTGRSLVYTTNPPAGGGAKIEINAFNMEVGRNGAIADSAHIYATGPITVVALTDMHLFPSSRIDNASGSVRLVVDELFPKSPDRGPGRFILDAGSTLLSAGEMQIYSAAQSQNLITAPINGVVVPFGQPFFNNRFEEWGVYFPDGKGGLPFKLFYKEAVPHYENTSNLFVVEMLKNNKAFDRLFFSRKCFFLEYDSTCYNRNFFPKGMMTSFDLFGNEEYEVLIQKYRNYQTLWIDRSWPFSL